MKRLRRKLDQWLVADAAHWNVSPGMVRCIFWLPIAGMVLLGLTRIHKGTFRFLTYEDGPVEWLQFAGFALACVFGVGVAIKQFRARYLSQAALYVLFALAAFAVAGEEIAWGQRILGIQTPAALKAINKQNEITVHNIQPVQDAFNWALLFVGAWGCSACFLNLRLHLNRFWNQASFLLVPPACLSSAFFVLFGYKCFRFVVWKDSGFTITKLGEGAELSLAFALCVWAWLNYRRPLNVEHWLRTDDAETTQINDGKLHLQRTAAPILLKGRDKTRDV